MPSEDLMSDLPVITMLLDMSDIHGFQYEKQPVFTQYMSF